MAKQLDFQLLPTLVAPDCYLMIGEIRINLFHETCEISVYIYASEDARHQRLSPSEVDLHRPLKVIVLNPTITAYNEYLQESGKALAAACYKLATEVEESISANPRGLKNLLASAKDV